MVGLPAANLFIHLLCRLPSLPCLAMPPHSARKDYLSLSSRLSVMNPLSAKEASPAVLINCHEQPALRGLGMKLVLPFSSGESQVPGERGSQAWLLPYR